MVKKPTKWLLLILLCLVVPYILLLSFGSWFVSGYRNTYKMAEFTEFKKDVMTKHDLIKNMKFYILQSGDLELCIYTKNNVEWSEIVNLFLNDISNFMLGAPMMKKIQEDCGDDPLVGRYPRLRVEFYYRFKDKNYAEFEAPYYNTYAVLKKTKENIIGYNIWYVYGDIVPENYGPIELDK